MYFLVRVETDNGTYNCVAVANSEFSAEHKATDYYRGDGEEVWHAQAEMFNSFEHGDINNYNIVL